MHSQPDKEGLMTMTINVKFYAGNLVSGIDCSNGNLIDFDKSVAEYCNRVQELLPEYKIGWILRNGQGPAARVTLPWGVEGDVTEDVADAVYWASNRVFESGDFWTK
jgi:hypothetical protein